MIRRYFLYYVAAALAVLFVPFSRRLNPMEWDIEHDIRDGKHFGTVWRNSRTRESVPIEQHLPGGKIVHSQTFTNENVDLSGKHFINCRFLGCKVLGSHYEIERCNLVLRETIYASLVSNGYWHDSDISTPQPESCG